MKLSFLRLRVLYLLVAISISALGTSSSWGQSCLCNGDVNNSGGMANVIDIAILTDCAGGDCSQCVNDCDVDCDGDTDYVDVGAVDCRVRGGTNCCNERSGACVGSATLPPCVVTTQLACEGIVFGGTYVGDGSFCNGDQAVPVPAASAWGLAALTLSLLTVGSLLLRPRRAKTIEP